MISWTDSHNHLQDERFLNPATIVSEMKAAGISRCIINATQESNWSAVEMMTHAEPNFVFAAFGIHPWKAHLAEDGWDERLRILLEKNPKASIGECGLDGWIPEPSLECQMPVFLAQLRLAREMQRPVTIHCLKAWQPLFDAFESVAPPEKFLMHSFGGSIEIARRLLPLGAYFSFSGYFLQPRKQKVLDVFKQLPKDRILLETDAPDMLPPQEIITHSRTDGLNHPANLPSIARALADHLNLDLSEISKLTTDNATRFFNL